MDADKSQTIETGIADLERELAFLVRRLEAIQRYRSYPLKRAHYLLLLILERDGPQPAGRIATELGLDASTVARQIAVMLESNLLEKKTDPSDGRSGILQATEHGLTRMSEMRSERLTRVEALFKDWQTKQRSELAEHLGQLNTSLEAVLNAESQT